MKNNELSVRIAALAAVPLSIVGAGARAQPAQQVKPPISVYWLSAETSAGMGIALPAGLGGLLPSAMQGGKRLKLDLGSVQQPSGEPRAAHAIPPALAMGASLPLVTPRGERPSPQQVPERTDPGTEPERADPPKGRMLVYWGCGEKIRAGQPVVLDFARMNPQDAARAFRSRPVSRPAGPAPGRSRSYGGWPNAENSTAVPAQGSLRGDHAITGNYSPEIRFSVSERHDFMEAVAFEPLRKGAGGALEVKWKAIPTAQGYFATAMGRGEGENDVVMWSSSEVQDTGQTLMDYLPPAELQRLIREKVVLAPQTTECAVPAGVFKGDGAMLNFIAYGDELNLAHPPRPSDPKQTWEPQWAVKLRLKSTGMMMLGEDDGRGSRASRAGAGEEGAPASERPGSASGPRLPNPADAVKEGINVLRGLFGR